MQYRRVRLLLRDLIEDPVKIIDHCPAGRGDLPGLSEVIEKTTAESKEASDEPETDSEAENFSETKTRARDAEETPQTGADPFPLILIIAGVLTVAGGIIALILIRKRKDIEK